LPDDLKFIYAAAFDQCTSLTTINLPAGLECIDSAAFRHCKSLRTINVPASLSLSFIGENIFHGCTSLPEIDLHA